jgi:N-acetylmuramoyl-L-alanine amidase
MPDRPRHSVSTGLVNFTRRHWQETFEAAEHSGVASRVGSASRLDITPQGNEQLAHVLQTRQEKISAYPRGGASSPVGNGYGAKLLSVFVTVVALCIGSYAYAGQLPQEIPAAQTRPQEIMANGYKQVIGNIKAYTTQQKLRFYAEPIANRYLYEWLAAHYGYNFYEPTGDVKGYDYYETLIGQIKQRWDDKVLVVEGHLNTTGGLMVFFKSKGKTYRLIVRKGAVVIEAWEGVSGILNYDTLLVEFGSLQGLFGLRPNAFVQKVNDLDTIIKWYQQHNNRYKDYTVVIVPGHGGLNPDAYYGKDSRGTKVWLVKPPKNKKP